MIWTACNTPRVYRFQLLCMFRMFPMQSCICIQWLSYIVPRNLICYLAVLMNFSILSLVSLHVVSWGVYGSIMFNMFVILYVFVILCVIDPGLSWGGWASWAGRDAVQDPGTGCTGQRHLVKDDSVFTVFCQYCCFPRFHPSFWYATTLGGDRWLFKGILRLESLDCCACISRIIWSFGCNSKIHHPSPGFLSLLTHLRGISAQTCCGCVMWLWLPYLGAMFLWEDRMIVEWLQVTGLFPKTSC